MAICKAGQSAFNDWGDEAILSEEFLIKDHQTWETGKVSINHENNNALLGKATIKDIEYDAETQLVWATFPDLPDKAKDLINSEFYEGLSQECVPLEMDGNKILKGYGLGVTIVTYPYKPAATPEMGVGVRPTASMFAAVASKYPEYNTGGEKTPEEDLKKIIDELKSTIDTLKSENAKLGEDLKEKDKTMESTVEKAVKAALESHDKAIKEASEYNEAVKELSSFMKPEDLEGFLSSKPAAGIIRATAAAMKATVASHIGSSGGGEGGKGGSGKVQSTWEAGKEVYEAAGLTLEDLEKYGEIEE
ncbi:hypothetical protein MSSAC_2781 [Methanosarcina siciliae C2J]|uniref:Phage protein n=1 Tax=Methanosarcina siciliae C2J TaxID=1434118 RepID=A0A0E3LDJ3_9EURY|nr:hypothetical protein [Methanosarcina siciliae]AKB37371.1 hypothetical protein MSSAC_2781 [Methanosarcina siciliae C2J]